MGEEKRMNFYRTFYDLTTLLPEAERRKVNTALLDYFFEGIEPTGLSDAGMKVFRGCEGRISKSRTNAANVASRHDNSKATNDATKPPTKAATKAATNDATKPPPERERERERDREGAKSVARFRAPSPAEVDECAKSYAAAKGIDLALTDFDPERFVDYYAQRGWKVGSAAMRDWAAAVRNWVRSSKPSERKETRDDYSCYD